MMNRLTTLLLVFWAWHAQAQIQSFRFEKNTYDFGTIKKSAGPVTFTFKFRNVNAEKAEVAFVEAQRLCECIVAEFSTVPVKHWETGEVKITYNPAKMPEGKFNNSVLLVSDFFEDNYKLNVIGTIIDDLPKDNPSQKTITELRKDEGFRKVFAIPMGFDVSFIDTTDAVFRKFVKDVAKTIKAEGGKGTLVIDACASQLTSKKYENKYKLSELRAEEAFRIIVALLRQEGVDDAQITFSANPFVDGPKLETEGTKSSMYQDFEYVKFKLK